MEAFSRYRSRITSTVQKFSECERGATAIEYGLLTAMISVTLIGVIMLIGNNITTALNLIVAALS
ncbi:MAG TPA: Flp family type IVb pilin [Xanthobacteraceae bacterium]|nr:Flp family type IVb pilin [Xanthobacteraceae bacterium]